jgi:hypothetical protein
VGSSLDPEPSLMFERVRPFESLQSLAREALL